MADTKIHHEQHGHGDALPGTIGHVLSPRTMITVLLILFGLTVVTVAVARLDFGRLNVVGALAIACVKASIVALWFMHLRYDKRFNFFIIIGSAALVVWMVSYILFDTKLYQDDMTNYRNKKTIEGKPIPE
jgi:cytochrome c oxidase subunit 4